MPKVDNKKRQPKTVSEKGYCRVCMDFKPISAFYEATNSVIDKNGYMSVCKDHCNDLFDEYFDEYKNMEKALYLTCQDLDVIFNKESLKQTQSHIEGLINKGKSAEKVFGYYKSKLGSTGKNNSRLESFRFKDSDELIDDQNNDVMSESYEEEIDEDLILFWGKGFNLDDIIFLELELSNWKQTHKCDNQAEITLLKEICIKILDIRKARERKENVGSLQKELQDLFKTCSVDPAKANSASAGKSHDCFGVWVKDIEQFSPAEWFEQQEKYKDMDGFAPYLKNYVSRPIENFLTGVRNFFVDDDIDANLDSVDCVSNNEGDSNG
ncbi:MAG: hypothetical protein PHX46_03960 [Bacilli bacterium]|nr:hypothetical protein [Bacilli bacterium]